MPIKQNGPGGHQVQVNECVVTFSFSALNYTAKRGKLQAIHLKYRRKP